MKLKTLLEIDQPKKKEKLGAIDTWYGNGASMHNAQKEIDRLAAERRKKRKEEESK